MEAQEELKQYFDKEKKLLCKNKKLKESQKRSHLVKRLNAWGGFATAVENSCFIGMPDIYGETPVGIPFWIECKVYKNKLSIKQNEWFTKLSKVQGYVVTFFDKSTTVFDFMNKRVLEFVEIQDVVKYILKIDTFNEK